MSVMLSIELVVTGSAEDVESFWARLKPKDEKLSSNHFLKLTSGQLSDAEEDFQDYEITKEQDTQLCIAWTGGFGGFDKAFSYLNFRDDGNTLSELFPRLVFTLYYDAHGAEFAGSYGYESYTLNGEKFSDDVYAGAVRYKAGVKIAEKVLTFEDYFVEDCSPPAEDVEEENFFDDDESVAEPDYENNRQKIDQALDAYQLRRSTLSNRDKWLKKWLKESSFEMQGLILERDFWKEVPLINTEAAFVDDTVARCALTQCAYSVLFIPKEIMTSEVQSTSLSNNEFLRVMTSTALSIDDASSDETNDEDHFKTIYVSLLVHLSTSGFVKRLIDKGPQQHPAEPGEESGSKVFRGIKYLADFNPLMGSLLNALTSALKSKNPRLFSETFQSIIRLWCTPPFDLDD